MGFYPILLRLDDKIALVAGGGKVAQRKVETLLEFGATVEIVAKELTPELEKFVDNGTIRRVGDEFNGRHLDHAGLVIAATDDRHLNHNIAGVARKKGVLVNAVDQPLDCDFIVPSILKRGELLIAVSTSGRSPALAKGIREGLEGQFGEEYETFLSLMGRLRKEIIGKGLSQEENSQIFHRIVRSDILKAISRDDWERVSSTLSKILPNSIDIKNILNNLR